VTLVRFRIALDRVRTVDDVRPGRNVIATEFRVGDRTPGQNPDGRAQTHRLDDDIAGVRELADVLECHRAPTRDGEDFVADPVPLLRVLGEQLQQPHDRGGDRFTARGQYRHDLVVDLLFPDGVAI